MSESSMPDLPIDTKLFNSMSAGVILSDENDNIIWVNDCFLEVMAAEESSVLGAPAAAFLKHNITATVIEPDVTRYETRNDSGDNLWLHCVKVTLPDARDRTCYLRLLMDITEFEHRQSIRPLVTTGIEYTRLDQITGVLNRRAIIQELNAEISRTRRYGNPLSVILLCYSVKTGANETVTNDVRQNIANCLNNQLRWVDKLGVVNEDEFLLVLPESNLDAAHQTWSKINDALQEITMRREQMNNEYTVAITTWARNDTPEIMLQRLHGMLEEPKVA